MQVTNDGATILKAIGVDNPAAKVLVGMIRSHYILPAMKIISFFLFLLEISKVQDDEVGDGTTSVTVLACELLKEAEELVSQKIHPQTIIAGWRKATDVARLALENSAIDNR
jgi:T-complex protein 1 subunit beta